MIAEAEHSGTTVQAPKPKPAYRPGEIPVLIRMQARNLYLHQSLPYKAISEATGLPVKTLEQLSFREKWASIRKANYARLAKSADARNGAMAEEVVEAIASASEQHAIRGLQRVGEALERTDEDAAKDFQALTAGVKNLATIARTMREPLSAQANEGSTVNLNLFFSQAPKSDPKQVTEVSAHTVQ